MKKPIRISFTPLHLMACGIVLGVTAMILVKLSLPGGLTQFGGFGGTFKERYIELISQHNIYIRENSGGYDGQFYAQLATDPWLTNPEFHNALDEPAYRSKRILLPLVSHLLAFGNPYGSILAYCSINIICWFLFAWLMWSILKVQNWKDFARWTASILAMGVMDSVKYSLTDLPSILLILLLIHYRERFRLGVAGGFITSLFLKETNALALASLPKWNGNDTFPNWKSVAYYTCIGVAGVAIFLIWYRHVNSIFGAFHGVHGNFDWPFTSMVRMSWQAIQELLAGNWNDRYVFRLIGIMGLLFQAIWFTTQFGKRHDPLIRLGMVYAFLFMFLGDLVWWGYWAGCRVVLPMTIAFNITYNPKASKLFWIGIIASNLTIIHAVYRFI